MHAPERELIEKIQAGDREAFRALYEAHGPTLLRFLQRLLGDPSAAEDALQETLLRVHGARETLDPERPLRPYLLRVARNVGIAAIRRQAIRKTQPVEGIDPAADETSPPSAVVRDETLAQVQAALARVPAGHRAALLLRHDQGLTLRAVAEALGVSERTARNRLREATVHLARTLREQGYVSGGQA
ncbi:MAG: RNA polymerase sigma factor [Planctomycetes bacterium]|nr:RNA polymerase sigma factor [Planctomycetota bacterium]